MFSVSPGSGLNYFMFLLSVLRIVQPGADPCLGHLYVLTGRPQA